MIESEKTIVSEIRSSSDLGRIFPDGFSFFEPYLQYYVKEILEIGGEAYASRTSEGAVSGIFIYDWYEKSGTIFTRSGEAFDHFYELKPFNFLFAELKTEHESETYDIYTVALDSRSIIHSFRHGISIAAECQKDELEQFMISTNPSINRKWVEVALKNGDKCFTVRLTNEIAGLGWISLVNGMGRLHSLYVKPQFRGLGIGEDLLFARLLWLKSKGAHSAFSEISRYNSASSKIGLKGGMTVSGQIFQYFGKGYAGKGREIPAKKARFWEPRI